MAGDDKVSPSEGDVVEASKSVLASNESMGIGRICAQVLEANPNWTLSEKRLRSILKQAGLKWGEAEATNGDHVNNGDVKSNGNNKKNKKKKGNSALATKTPGDSAVPSSHLDEDVPIPSGVRAVYFDEIKGKGLVADRDFNEGETLFTEEAFLSAPPAHAYNQVSTGELCTQCFLPVAASSLNVACGQKDCNARFCSRLCQNKAQSLHHALLCPGQNPSIKPFNKYVGVHRWLSLSMVARMLCRILLTHSSTPPPALASTSVSSGSSSRQSPAVASLEETLAHLDAFATISELERRCRNPGWSIERESFLSAMKEGHRLLVAGLDPHLPETTPRKGRYPIRTSFPVNVSQQVLSWNTFLAYLGRSNLNTEAQGGMYLVHSHLNHACEPNVGVTHPPHPRAGIRQATKVAVVARRAIKAGEELFITYQDPSLSLARRRLLLWREYMFGPCRCARCERELADLSDEERQSMEDGEAWKVDKEEDGEVEKRRKHAEMLRSLEEERNAKLRSEGKKVPTEEDLRGMEDELRASLGF